MRSWKYKYIVLLFAWFLISARWLSLCEHKITYFLHDQAHDTCECNEEFQPAFSLSRWATRATRASKTWMLTHLQVQAHDACECNERFYLLPVLMCDMCDQTCMLTHLHVQARATCECNVGPDPRPSCLDVQYIQAQPVCWLMSIRVQWFLLF
jgi:hypothetical protein